MIVLSWRGRLLRWMRESGLFVWPLNSALMVGLTMFVEGTRCRPKTLAAVGSLYYMLIVRVKRTLERKDCPSLTMFFYLVIKDLLQRWRHSEAVIFGIFMVRSRLSRLTIDLTIAYNPMDVPPPNMVQIFCLKRISPYYQFHVHVRRYDIDDVDLLHIVLTVVAWRGREVGEMAHESLDWKGQNSCKNENRLAGNYQISLEILN